MYFNKNGFILAIFIVLFVCSCGGQHDYQKDYSRFETAKILINGATVTVSKCELSDLPGTKKYALWLNFDDADKTVILALSNQPKEVGEKIQIKKEDMRLAPSRNIYLDLTF